MLNSLISFSLNNRLIVLLMTVILMVGGTYILRIMDIDVFPDLTAPTVTVLTEAHGLEAVEVERLVTYQVETTLNGAPHVRRIRSTSMDGISIVWVEFDWGTEIYKARQIISEKLAQVGGRLPLDVEEPFLAPIASIMGEIMLIGVNSDTLSPREVRTIADWNIVPQLKALQGVAHVLVIGGEKKQYQVLASPQRLEHYGVSLQELSEAVQEANLNTSGGLMTEFGNHYTIKSEGRIYSVEELESAMVKSVEGSPISISDVAEVKIGASDKIGDGSVNANPGVVITVLKQPQTNTLALTQLVTSTLEKMQDTLPKGLNIQSNIFRQSDFISASVSNLQRTLLEGAFFVIIVLFIFLFSWRTTLISIIAIPLSLVGTIVVLYYLGYTINTMSLGGMAIAIGALVDDAIIDVENVYKRLRENWRSDLSFAEMVKVIYHASVEIRSSIAIATMIIIVSFVPLFFLTGIEGRLLQPLGIAFILSLLVSLVVAVTLTPVLCSYLLAKGSVLTSNTEGTRLERALRLGYEKVLGHILKVPKLMVVITVSLLVLSIFFATKLGRSFLPEFSEGSLVISVVGRPGISIEESNRAGRLVEETLLSFPEVRIVSRRTGRAEADEHAQGVNASEVDAPFELKGRSKLQFLNEVRNALSRVPGVNVTIGQPIAHRIDHMLSGTRANIAIKVFGDDLGRLYQIGQRISELTGGVPGFVDVSVEQQIEVPQIRIVPNSTMLSAHGISKGDFAHFVETAFQGEVVSQVFEGQRSFDLVVRYEPKSRIGFDQIASALVDLPDGEKVRLDQVAEIKSVSTPLMVSRENVQRKLVVSGNVSGRDLRGVVLDIQQIIDSQLVLPTGYWIEYGGQFESEERASRLLLFSSILAVIAIYVLLYYEFKNLKLAAIVLANLPLALIGGILAVYFTTGIVSIASTIGFIGLFGIASRNGILLVSRYQALRFEHDDLAEVIRLGSLDRITPILMTSLTTALALIPLALAGGEPGNEIQSPMAVVILGGLLSSTFLNLFVIPCIYWLLYRKQPTAAH